MYYLHLRALIILWFFVFMGVLNCIYAQTNENEQSSEVSEEILIFRTSPGKEKIAEGWFRFQVSTFSPIMVIKVNGFAQMVKLNSDWAEIEIPFYLKIGKNLFTIFVQTENGQKEQEFIVTYEPQKKERKKPPPLNGVVMLGQTNSDNILSAQDGGSKTSASKNDFLLSSAYAFEINEESDVSINAVLKFDRHQNRSLATEEVLFRQISTEYRHKNLLGLDLKTGLGQSVISVKDEIPSNPSKAGEFREDLRSIYFFLDSKKHWGRIFSGSLKIQYDTQNKVKTNSEDGSLTLASLGAKMRWEEFRFNGRIDALSTQFQDSSMDYQSTMIDLATIYSWNPWVFGFNFQNNDKQFQNVDPGSNLILQDKKDELALNFKYSFSNSTLAGADLKQIKQSSNDETRSYKANQITVQYIWMF